MGTHEKTGVCNSSHTVCDTDISRFHMGNDKGMGLVLKLIKDENGFIAVSIFITYIVFALTLFAFILGITAGVYKQAHAKYMWFGECMDFTAQASNMTGGNGGEVGVDIDINMAKQYFVAAMDEIMGDYTLKRFNYCTDGSGYPGFEAEIVVPVFSGKVPLIGKQKVDIPMKYFAVVQSKGLKEK